MIPIYKALLIIIGLVMIGLAAFPERVQLTLILDTGPPEILLVDPPGTKDSPTILYANNNITLRVEAYDEPPGNITWVRVTINSSSGYSNFLNLTSYTTKLDVNGRNITEYRVTWQVPSNEGVGYTFLWEVTDKSGNYSSAISYAVVGGVLPEGFFVLNNVPINDTGNFWFNTPDMVLEFRVTKYEEILKNVYVEVYNETGVIVSSNMSKVGAVLWQLSFTLPMDGYYEIKGVITTIDNLDYTKLSIILNLGEPSAIREIPISSVYRISFFILGAVMIYYGYTGLKVKRGKRFIL